MMISKCIYKTSKPIPTYETSNNDDDNNNRPLKKNYETITTGFSKQHILDEKRTFRWLHCELNYSVLLIGKTKAKYIKIESIFNRNNDWIHLQRYRIMSFIQITYNKKNFKK